MVAGAIVVGILVLVMQRGKDLEETGEPDDPDTPTARNILYNKQLAEIERELESLLGDFDIQWATKSNMLPRSPPVKESCEDMARRLQMLRRMSDDNRGELPQSFTTSLTAVRIRRKQLSMRFC